MILASVFSFLDHGHHTNPGPSYSSLDSYQSTAWVILIPGSLLPISPPIQLPVSRLMLTETIFIVFLFLLF